MGGAQMRFDRVSHFSFVAFDARDPSGCISELCERAEFVCLNFINFARTRTEHEHEKPSPKSETLLRRVAEENSPPTRLGKNGKAFFVNDRTKSRNLYYIAVRRGGW